MSLDLHQEGDCYEIRSLYFDDAWDSCMNENAAGVDQREKYRIRIYGPESDVIHLEIKEKNRGLTKKRSCELTREEAAIIIFLRLRIVIVWFTSNKYLQSLSTMKRV